KPSTASLHPMQHHMRGTVRTLADPSARGASQDRRVSSPVQEHQHLLVSLQPLFDGLHHLWRESLLQPQPARVDHLDVRHWRLACPTCKFEGGIAAVEGMVPRFQGWRCRTEYNRDLQIMATPYRQVSCGIPQTVLLLVRGVMLLIDHDETQVRHRRGDGHAGAEQDACIASGGLQPGLQALPVRKTTVQNGKGVSPTEVGEARSENAFELW